MIYSRLLKVEKSDVCSEWMMKHKVKGISFLIHIKLKAHGLSYSKSYLASNIGPVISA